MLAFGASLLALRLAGALIRRWRVRRAPELAAWAAGLLAYGLAAAAMAWGAAAGWNEASFRVYYICGGMLTASLLGVGSLLLVRKRRALPVGLVYAVVSVVVATAEPLTRGIAGTEIPDASEHLDLFPVRTLAIAGNLAGTIAVVGVALATIRRRPVANVLTIAGIAVAAVGSAVAGLGVAGSAVFVAVGAALLYLGFLRRT